MTLQPLPLDFFIYEENIFYQCNKEGLPDPNQDDGWLVGGGGFPLS
jgi:hypothetical protein